MESPAKKRSLFGFTGLWRSSTAPPADSDATTKSRTLSSAGDRHAVSRIESGNASAPESPVKRASDTQLASRKILSKPQGPSSKLSQSFTAADFDRLERSTTAAPKSLSFSESIGTAPRRRPGDNPYKASSYSSATISGTPTAQRPTNFSTTASTPRNIFRSSAIYQRPDIPSFSPRVPTNTMKQSFLPATPGRPPRSMGADVSGRGLANTTSSDLFEMRISSPPRHLTGEMLTKELQDRPKDPSRSGSIYADEFLAHLCPPDLDEQQQRQFFCILDLRRLKYSADEVFTKKDWKINVLNFAKEYEKNRSLIMLRYGLYEFKTVRASEAVKKEWKQKHGIPDSEDEDETMAVAKTSVIGSKRKAEDDLKSTDSALTSSSSNANKRARAPEATAPAKNKRKADDEPDENQPAKQLKPGATPQKAPSATKSMFESIANNGASTTPAKAPAKSLFTTAPKLPNGTGGRSVLDVSSKPPAAPTNIFGHLSDASKGSPNDDADAESEADSAEGDEGESGGQDASTSEEPGSATDEAPTPKYSEKVPSTANNTSTTSSEAGESFQGRSIFDRITRGSDGQPVRQLPSQQGVSPYAVSPDKERSVSPAKDIATPINNTWNTNTPIKFTSGSLAAPTPVLKPTIDFGASIAKKPETEAPVQAAPNMFATNKPPDVATTDAPKPAESAKRATASTSSLFGASGTGAAPTATPSGTMFSLGSTASSFGQPKDKEEKEKEAPKPAGSLFSSTPAQPAKSNLFQSSSLFGNQGTPALAQSTTSLFNKPSTEASAAVGSLFGQAASKSQFPAGAAASSTEEPAAKKLFGGDKPGASLFGAGASTPAPATKSLFPTPGAKPKPSEPKPLFGSGNAAESKPLFGATAPAAADSKPLFGAPAVPKPLFGASATPEQKPLFSTSTAESKPAFAFNPTPAANTTASEPKPLFGAAAAPATSQEIKPLFSSAPATQPEAPKTSLFTSTSTAAPSSVFSFGSQPTASQPATSQPAGTGSIFGTGGSTSFTFSAGGSDTTIKNPFASGSVTSAPPSFNFGTGNDSSQTTTFQFGGAPTISFGGDSQPTQPNTSFGGSFTFGGSSQPNGLNFSQKPPSTTSMFGSTLAPGGGTSTGTSMSDPFSVSKTPLTKADSPFNFGGASSLATTPATGTPEPAAEPEESKGTKADGDDDQQEQISLTEGGPGEEDETVIHEVRAKAVKLVTGGDSEDDSSSSKTKNPWKTQGVGPLRILKHKTTGAVRMLLRAEPRGHVALNKLVLPNFSYKVDPAGGKYVKLTTASDDGKSLETWMLQVKTPAAAKELAESLEANKAANKT